MTEIDHDESNVEQRLRRHYQQRYEPLPSPDVVWTQVQPELDRPGKRESMPAQHPKWWLSLAGFLIARRQDAFVQRQEEDKLMEDAIKISQPKREKAHFAQHRHPFRLRLRHTLEAAIAVLIVASLLLGWFTVTRWGSTQGNGPALFTYTGQPGEGVYDSQWTPDGKHLVFALSTLTNHYRYLVWDAASGKVRQTLAFSLPSEQPGGASAPYGNVIVSSDEHYLFISTYGATKQTGIIKLANILTGQIKLIYQGVYQGQSSPVIPQAVLSNDNKYLAFIGADQRIHVWNVATGKTMLTSDPIGSVSGSLLSWSADDRRINLETGFNTPKSLLKLQVWDAQTGHRLVNIVETPTMSLFFTPPEPRATLGDISPDGTRILTYNQQAGTFEERDINTLHVLQTFHVQVTQSGSATTGGEMFIPYWQANGTRLFLVKNQTAFIWNAITGQLLSAIPLNGAIQGIKVQPLFGRYMALMQQGNLIVIRDMVTGADVRTIAPIVKVGLVFWSPDGEYLNISDENSYGQIYNAFTGKLIASYQGDYWGVVLSPDLQYIATAKTVNDPGSGAPLKSTIKVLSIA